MNAGIRYANYSENPTGFSSHYHDVHQLLFVAEGSAEVTVGEQTYPLTGGSLVIISRFEKHAITVKSPSYHRYILRFSPKREETARLPEGLFSLLIDRRPGFQNVLPIGDDAAVVETCFATLVREFEDDRPHKEDLLAALLQTLWVLIRRHLPTDDADLAAPAHETVAALQKRLEERYAEPCTLAELAEDYHINPYYLSHLFKKVTGRSIFEYRLACRITAAKYDLTHTALPVARIFERCGFSDASNFSRAFKKATGFTPTAFRDRFKA